MDALHNLVRISSVAAYGRWVAMLATLAGLCLGGAAARAKDVVEYSLKGTLVISNSLWAGTPYAISRLDFEVYVQDAHWLIRSWNLGTNGQRGRGMECGSTNGQDLICAILDSDYRMMSVREFTFPFRHMNQYLTYVWLGFASHAYGGGTNDLPPPLFELHDQPGPLHEPFRAICRRLSSEPPLPEFIAWFNNSYIEYIDPTGQQRAAFLPYPFDKGYTNGSYHITGLTNVGRLRLPTGFVYDHNKRNSGPTLYTENRLAVPYFRVTAQVLEARDECPIGSIVSALASKTPIMDFRTNDPIPKLMAELAAIQAKLPRTGGFVLKGQELPLPAKPAPVPPAPVPPAPVPPAPVPSAPGGRRPPWGWLAFGFAAVLPALLAIRLSWRGSARPPRSEP